MSFLAGARQRAVTALGAVEGEAITARLELRQGELVSALEQLYAARVDATDLLGRIVDRVLDAASSRSEPLRVLDRRREVDLSWFQRPETIGYVCYVDRFAGDLAGVRRRLDYLGELAVTYLHLMPLLRPRDGDNDGGYAVIDYGSVDPRLGTMADLEGLASDLHTRGMSLCIDLVLNHTAAEHP